MLRFTVLCKWGVLTSFIMKHNIIQKYMHTNASGIVLKFVYIIYFALVDYGIQKGAHAKIRLS